MSIYLIIFFPLIIISSLFVIISNNSVTSVLYLISVFILTSIILLLLGAELLSILIIIIYIGAISILFLFVIMLLNLRIVEVYNSLLNYIPIGSFIAIFFLFLFILSINLDLNIFLLNNNNNLIEMDKYNYNLVWSYNNLYLLGDLLYNTYNYVIVLISFVLLVAMVGSIYLTLDSSYHEIKSQEISILSSLNLRKNRITFWSISENSIQNK